MHFAIHNFWFLDYASANISYGIGCGDSTNATETAEANSFTSAPAKNISRFAFDTHRSKLTVMAGFSAERKTVYSIQPDCARAAFATSHNACRTLISFPGLASAVVVITKSEFFTLRIFFNDSVIQFMFVSKLTSLHNSVIYLSAVMGIVIEGDCQKVDS